jgi:hypothetical protein
VDDREIMSEINRLVKEEHRLDRRHMGKPLSSDDEQYVRSIHIARDRCWDLLRQLRARRNAGQDPADIELRPPTVVKPYRQ